MYECKERDWKLYRRRIGQWQENFMDKLLKEYRDIIDSDKAPSERFWQLNDRIKDDKRYTGVLADNRRSRLAFNLADLLTEGAITLDDLDGFSDDLIDYVRRIAEM